jgi:hypothetical protein
MAGLADGAVGPCKIAKWRGAGNGRSGMTKATNQILAVEGPQRALSKREENRRRTKA